MKKWDRNKLEASYIGRRMLEKNTYFSNVLSQTEFIEMPCVTLANGQRKQRLGKEIKFNLSGSFANRRLASRKNFLRSSVSPAVVVALVKK